MLQTSFIQEIYLARMNRMKIAILGHFAENKEFCDGQTVKTRELYNAFKDYSNCSLTKIDTYNWKRHPFKLLLNIKKHLNNSDVLIIMPASNGVKVFVPIINHFNKKHKCKIFYSVIGSWLSNLAKQKGKNFILQLDKLDGIWAETKKLKDDLENLGLKNVKIIENFKNLSLANIDKVKIYDEEVRRFCTFSRVIKEKGITLAICAIAEINFNHKNIVAKLDIYGPIGEDYKNEFFGLINKYKDFIEYKGVIDPQSSVDILSKYYCLLFPTFYKGECLPGTIIDAFFAGLPIIASDWPSCRDILNDNCAIIYDYNSKQIGLEKSIKKILGINKSDYLLMSEHCQEIAEQYKTDNIMGKIFDEIS